MEAARRLLVFVLLLAVVAAAQVGWSRPAAASTASTASTVKITLDGGRFFLLHYQPGRMGRTPLIVALHGFGGSAGGTAGTTGLSAWADARGNDVNIAYPEGVDSEWNAGPDTGDLGCCGGSTTDDVGFLRDVVVAVATAIPTNFAVVWGFSNGGMMAMRAVCEATSLFAAAATVEAGPAETCNYPVRLAAIHQARDQTVQLAGGAVTVGRQVIGHTLPDSRASFPNGSRVDVHLCTAPTNTATYHSWTSPCWPTTSQVDDLLWSSLTGTHVSPPAG